MSYKIEIKEIQDEIIKGRKEWKKLFDIDERIRRDGDANYGYVDVPEYTATKEIKVLEQTVNTLDLQAVIKAINGLK